MNSTSIELFHDKANDRVVYRHPSPGTLLASIPTARGFNHHFVSVPRDLWSMQMAARLQLPVMPVITDLNYDWPRPPGITPLPHQKIMANFCVLHPKCFNLSDMGTMKTLSTLWAADFLMRSRPGLRALIVAPLSTLRVVWESAIFSSFMGKRTWRVLDGDAKKRRQLLAEPADFYIINFDGAVIGASTSGAKLTGLSADIADRQDIRLIIIDEASAYKHATRRRHRVARQLFRRDYLWMLTGTPTAQSHLDAFGLAKLLNDANGESYGSFVNRTTIQLSRFKRVPTRDAYDEARKLLTPAIRYDIRDVWNGPEFTTQFREIELTPEQKKHLKDLRVRLMVELESGKQISPANEAALRTKYLQIAMGAIYDSDHAAHAIESAPRINALVEVLETAPSKVILLAPLTSIVELLYRRLDGFDRRVIYGATPAKERAEIIRAFQNEENPRLIIADPGCLSHGVDLFRAQTVVWYGPTDKAEVYLQANKRAHRPGQKFPVTVVQMVATKLEREIFARLQNSQQLQGLMLQMVRDSKL